MLGGYVTGKNNGVKGNTAIAVVGDGEVYEFDGAEGWEIDVRNIDELFGEVKNNNTIINNY